jgi:hypothetical protein
MSPFKLPSKNDKAQHGSSSRGQKLDARLDPTMRGPVGSRMAKMDQTMRPGEGSKMSKMDQTMRPPEISRMGGMDRGWKHTENSRMGRIDNGGSGGRGYGRMADMDPAERAAREKQLSKVEVKDPKAKPLKYSSRDQQMASRQTRIDSLSAAERAEQEEWAQLQLQLSGACPAGFRWTRQVGGYRCWAGGHWVSDESIALGIIYVEPYSGRRRLITPFSQLLVVGQVDNYELCPHHQGRYSP